MSRKILVLAVLALLLSSASYAGSTRGNVNGSTSRSYGFTMPSTGTVEITLTWNQNHDDLFILMACGSGGDALEYSSVAAEARVVRLDAGVLGGLVCAFRVSSFQRQGAFTVVVSRTVAGSNLIPLSLSRGSDSLELAELDEREAAAFGLTDLENKMRSLR